MHLYEDLMHCESPCFFKTPKGLNKHVVIQISEQKNEPGWMTDFRLKALALFERMPMPKWGVDLHDLNINDICYYLRPLEQRCCSWSDMPVDMKATFEHVGIVRAEQEFLAGVGAQYESEVVYKNLKDQWVKQGVIFVDMNEGLDTFSDLFKRYFATIVPAHDNKFAALNAAVWSGGSFIYVPKGVHVEMPLQAYFMINEPYLGQFERTLIIADEGSSVHYIEGCSAPRYTLSSLHSAVVELCAHADARIRYTTIQNWSHNVYNLVTKRAVAYRNAIIEWVDGNFGSNVTMKYPSIILKERGARGQLISLSVANGGQHLDTGGKMIHMAPDTTSHVISKSLSKNGGRASYRGLLKIVHGATGVRSRVICDALLFDDTSRADTYPTMGVHEKQVDIGHEASIKKIDEDYLFYLMTRGLHKDQARALIIHGFIDVFVEALPMEYAVEINRFIACEMEGSVG